MGTVSREYTLGAEQQKQAENITVPSDKNRTLQQALERPSTANPVMVSRMRKATTIAAHRHQWRKPSIQKRIDSNECDRENQSLSVNQSTMSGFNVAGVSKTIQNRRKSSKVVNQKLFGTVRSRVCSSIDEVNGSGNGD